MILWMCLFSATCAQPSNSNDNPQHNPNKSSHLIKDIRKLYRLDESSWDNKQVEWENAQGIQMETRLRNMKDAKIIKEI